MRNKIFRFTKKTDRLAGALLAGFLMNLRILERIKINSARAILCLRDFQIIFKSLWAFRFFNVELSFGIAQIVCHGTWERIQIQVALDVPEISKNSSNYKIHEPKWVSGETSRWLLAASHAQLTKPSMQAFKTFQSCNQVAQVDRPEKLPHHFKLENLLKFLVQIIIPAAIIFHIC